MGQDNDYADLIAGALLDSFDQSLADKRNERGGVYRAGTGTAMYYIFHSNQLRATPDGRNDGEMIPANYSPACFSSKKDRYLLLNHLPSSTWIVLSMAAPHPGIRPVCIQQRRNH